jgi:hypothetical protein
MRAEMPLLCSWVCTLGSCVSSECFQWFELFFSPHLHPELVRNRKQQRAVVTRTFLCIERSSWEGMWT